MQLEHSFTVPVAVDEAWTVLLDIERIAPCMPGAAIDTIDGDDFTGTVKVKLGPIALTYKGKASFVEKDEGAHRVAINAQGRDQRGNGTAAAKVTATLQQDGEQTKVDVVTELDITGKPAQFGRGVMVDVGNKLIGQFADCLAGKLSDAGAPQSPTDEVSEPAAESAAAAPESQPAAEPAQKAPAKKAVKSAAKPAPKPAPPKSAAKPAAKSAAKKTAAAESTSEAAAAAAPDQATQPAEPVAAVPAPEVAPRPEPRKIAQPAEVEPINLIESAGPAVAKRLAPVFAAVVLLLIVLRRLRRS